MALQFNQFENQEASSVFHVGCTPTTKVVVAPQIYTCLYNMHATKCNIDTYKVIHVILHIY